MWERIIKKITDNVFQRIDLHAAVHVQMQDVSFGTVFESMDFSVYLKYGTGKKEIIIVVLIMI